METLPQRMDPDSKRRKLKPASNFGSSPSQSQVEKQAAGIASNVPSVLQQPPLSDTQLRIQKAKNFAVVQAQQDGSKGNYRIFDSPFGNFLVPVVPSKADLSG